MSQSPSFRFRAISALALFVGFYALALAIAGALLYVVYLDVVVAGRLHLKLLLICVVAAGTILWGILPRFDRFQPPGPRLTREGQSRLFTEIESVARDTGQAMPEEVYLVADVNAWVAQRGGLLGFGGRRVMGLGLPLLQGLTREQMRAVLAHEFGHYHGGDTALGPLLYRTRAAIGRTIAGFEEGSWLQIPFRLYGNMFLRVTHASSRAQEFAADALAARVTSGAAMVGGLRALPALAQGFPMYWQSEFVPVLGAGYRVPLASGFGEFMKQPFVADQLRKVEEVALGASAGSPYDTHPPLPQRISAVESLSDARAAGTTAADATPAVDLLDDVDALERELLEHLYGAEPIGELKPLTWEEQPQKVLLPLYRGQLRAQGAALQGVTAARLAELARSPQEIASRLAVAPGEAPPQEERERFARHLLGAGLVVALHDAGWTLACAPGTPATLRKGDRSVEPFALIERFAAGERPAETWPAEAAKLGIADVELGAVDGRPARPPT